MISIIIAGLALAQSMGLVPTEDLENGGTVVSLTRTVDILETDLRL